MAGLRFNRDFDPRWGETVELAPGLRRLTLHNPGPYTFQGTNCYLLGTRDITVIDPGPADPMALATILAASGGRISHILVTHTHRDHSPGVAALQAATGAIVFGPTQHRFTRPLHEGEATSLDASGDFDFRADYELGDGDPVVTPAGRLEVIETPGHTANHLCFQLEGSGFLFSGDHVMGWSTSIVAPPDGAMADYVASLDKLLLAADAAYLPGHGGEISGGHDFVHALKAHRAIRESAVVAAIGAGARDIAEIVRRVYVGLDPSLAAAAGLSVFAQLEWLVSRGIVATDGPPALSGEFRPA